MTLPRPSTGSSRIAAELNDDELLEIGRAK
jgi:hypothetical protein